MSQERAPVIKKLLQAAFDSISRQQIEDVLDGFEPDVEFSLVGFEGIGLAASYKGHEGWFEWAADIFDTWADPVWTVAWVRDGGDRFVAEIDFVARGKASGAEARMTWAAAYYLTPSGKIARQDTFYGQDGWKLALEGAGLSE